MANSLGDDAARLIKECQEYLSIGPIVWDSDKKLHMVPLMTPAIKVRLVELPGFLQARRDDIIADIIQHLFQEVGQARYGGGHGSRNTYNRGCRGLLCRRANREELRELQGQNPSARFAVPDELLDEAESRILPEEIVGHIRYADKVAVS